MNTPATQPTVRSSTLATNNPNVAQRAQQPGNGLPQNNATQPATQGGSTPPPAAAAPQRAKKGPRGPRREKLSIVAGVELTALELQAFGRIALKAEQQHMTSSEYIRILKEDIGAELAVWDKVYGAVKQQAAEGPGDEP